MHFVANFPKIGALILLHLFKTLSMYALAEGRPPVTTYDHTHDHPGATSAPCKLCVLQLISVTFTAAKQCSTG